MSPTQSTLPGIPTQQPDWQLRRNAFGQLELIDGAGAHHAPVVPVRAFPLSAPEESVSMVGPQGDELAFIDLLITLPAPIQTLVREELREREFMPTLLRIESVSSFATPSTWRVVTDQGDTTLVLRGEEDIRRLEGPALLIADNHGLHYRIPDRWALDQHSRTLLDRFL